MKFPYFKFLLIAGAMFLAWNCSDESSLPLSTDQNTVSEEVKVLKTEKGTVYITDDNEVKDEDGNIIGEYDPKKKKVTTDDGDVYDNVDKGDLDDGELKYSSASNEANSSSSKKSNNQTSSATNQNTDGKCFDAPSGKYVDPYENLRGPKNESYAYDNQCNLKCYWSEGDGSTCSGIKNATPPSSNSTPNSSSSSKKQSSSSKANTNTGDGSKYIDAGKGGTPGRASRYWDCCMPHCAQPDHGGKASACYINGGKTKIQDKSREKNVCQEGGQAGACTSQTPIIVSDKVAYAFAATPGGNDATCGKCFALTFTGQGFYETKTNHQKLLGKTLVVMASNIGYDVAGGQFDVMIPGGGFGQFNGCSKMGWNIPGNSETYGGLLSDCEREVGYNGDVYEARKSCLTKKCNSAFANDTEAKEGCLFLATWMEAAGNPTLEYKEVECPQALKDKF